MRLGLCLSPETAAAWPDLPGDYVEVNVQKQLMPEAPDSDFAASALALRALPLPVLAANCFLPGELRVVGPDRDLPRLGRYARVAFARAAQVGIRHIVFGSAGARRVPDGFSRTTALDQFAEALHLLGPIAAEHEVTVVVEPLNRSECNLLNTVHEGSLVVSRVDQRSIRLLADLYHVAVNGEDPQTLAENAALLAHAHVAEKATRSAPGLAGDDFSPYLLALQRGGYRGNLSIECVFGSDPWRESLAGIAELHRQLTQLSRPSLTAPLQFDRA